MSEIKYAVSHTYVDKNGVWHEAEFVNLERFADKDSARRWIEGINWQFHHMEGEAEVFLYPGELCNPPQSTFLETQKMYIREVRD